MPELHLQRNEASLIVSLGELHATVPLERIVPDTTLWMQIYADATTYGHNLFEQTFGREERMKTLLAEMPARQRLLLLADDPLIAQIPWEYLRDQNNKLLASRLTLVRSVSGLQIASPYIPVGPLDIIAIPAAPIDESVHLHVEQEWRQLVKVVTNLSPARALTLKRLRPPTRSSLAGALSRQGTSIVHFMGHGMLHDDKAYLVFEDAHGRQQFVDAADLADTLNEQVLLVILNSCLSALVAPTEFSNIAQALVRRGVPYALGMQCILPDEAAQVLSRELLHSLLQGSTLEEAMMHTRRALQELGQASHPDWLAGLPVLYTSQRERPTAPLTLTSGQATVSPDPRHLEAFVDLIALPPAEHFVGRVGALSELLDPLLSPSAHGFVMLHGLGGIGKTSLARVAAERVGWYYEDRVLAVSFETFATLDANNQRVVNEAFVDRFYTSLATLYRLDPAQYMTVAELQKAILRERTHQRSLLILDNVETLLDALAHPVAQGCATFLVRLKEGEGVILLTSRMFAPADWGIEANKILTLTGLPAESGAELFQAFVSADRRHLAAREACLALSQRVQGHPLSIRLLVSRFADETVLDLATFLHNINEELVAAERATPGSLDDPARQKTLYACMDYSIRRLYPEQRIVLDTVSLFQAPFIEEFATTVLDDTEQTPLHLHHLVRLGLLNRITRTFAEGELILFEFHPMVRWYIELGRPELAASVKERYGEIYASLVRDAAQPASDYERSALVRALIRQSFVDCEAAGAYLTLAASSSLAYHLARLYYQLGQIRRTLDLYERSLQTYQELGEVRGVAVTQYAMAGVYVQQGKVEEGLRLYAQSLQTSQELGDVQGMAATQYALAYVYVQQGKVEEALKLYEESLQTAQELGDVQGVAVTQGAMADVYVQQGKVEEGLRLYAQSLQTAQELGEVRSVAVTQNAMAGVYVQQGKVEEALMLYEQSLQTKQELGDVRGVAVTQNALANVYVQQGKVEEGLRLYAQSLQTYHELGDVRGVAVTQHAMASVYVQQGKVEEGLQLYAQSLQKKQELEDVRSVAATQYALADVYVQQGKVEEGLRLYAQSLQTYQELGDVRSVAVTQNALANVYVQQGKVEDALRLYAQSLQTKQELGDVQGVAATQHALADVYVQQGKVEEGLRLYAQSLQIYQELGDVRGVAVTQHAQADVYVQQGKVEEALRLYAQSLQTFQELGDVQGVAMTQVNMGYLLMQMGKHRQALSLIWEAHKSLMALHFVPDVQAVQQILTHFKAQDLGNKLFDRIWQEAIEEIQPEWLRDVQSDARRPEDVVSLSDEAQQALSAYFEAADWREKRQVVETQQELLFQPAIEQVIEQLIEYVQGQGDQRRVGFFELHLALLRNCKSAGVASAFEQLEAVISEAEGEKLPFAPELIAQSVTALLGSPQEKMVYMQYLAGQVAQTTDEQLKALLSTIQLALFSTDLSAFGRDLEGVYRQAWEMIVASVEAGG